MKRAGGIRVYEFTPTIDGNFDRISTEIDPAFGTEDEYTSLVRHARDSGAVVIGDIIPGHSGKGADFRLADNFPMQTAGKQSILVKNNGIPPRGV